MNLHPHPSRVAIGYSKKVKYTLIILTFLFLALFLLFPLSIIFGASFSKGFSGYWAAITDPYAVSAIKLTLITAAFVVPINTIFGLAAAWAITKFQFVGRQVLITLISLPFAVSPVVAGLTLVLLYGRNGWLGPWLAAHHIKIIYATPAIILATLFVTFPFVVGELIPTMEGQGSEDEQAALSLGATGWQTFWRVTLSNIKWALFYGIILCNARAMGEFGAVSVVSGHIQGQTNTLPLHIEILYDGYKPQAAFAVSTLLTALAILTLIAKPYFNWRNRSSRKFL